MPNKAILLLIPSVGFGGAERVFHDHSVAFSKKYKVIECVFNREGQQSYKSYNELLSLDVPAGKSLWQKVYFFLLRCVRLKRFKGKNNIDICISHLEGADYVNLLSKGREKVILCIHGSKLYDKNISGPLGWIRKSLLMPALYNRADAIITVSRDINTELVKGFGVKPSKIKTINNFFDIEKISISAVEPLFHYQELFINYQTIITSGRLANRKNQASLLHVFSLLLRSYVCKLIILGDGELRNNLISISKELGLRTFTVWDGTSYKEGEFDVYFLGYQNNPFKYIKNSTVFAFPSAWEGFPMALCEAMICGTPVITTDCPTGPREILAPKSLPNQDIIQEEYAEFGVLMPMLHSSNTPNEIEIWVNTLKYLLADSKIRQLYSEKARLRMLDFTPNKIINQWEQVIESVL